MKDKLLYSLSEGDRMNLWCATDDADDNGLKDKDTAMMMTTHFNLMRSLAKEDYFFSHYRHHGTRQQDSFTFWFILQNMLGQSIYSCFKSGKFQVSISANRLAILICFLQSL